MIIGALNLLKMLITAIWGNPFGKWIEFENGVAAVLWTSILAFFFAVKFGGFVLGTGLFALILPAFFDPESGATAAIDAFRDQGLSIAIGAAALAVSHTISLVLNFVGRREYERTNLFVLLFWPYARVLWLHLMMIAGVIAVALMPLEERSLVFAVALVLIKLAGDVASHLVERRKFGIRNSAARHQERNSVT